MSRAAALEWIEKVQQFAFFRAADVPCPLAEAEAILVELLNEDIPSVGKTPVDGLWYREPPLVHHLFQKPEWNARYMAQALMPPGSGLAGMSALWSAGWTQQFPIRHRFTTIADGYELPEIPPYGIAGLKVNSNPRRADLSWHEVSLLEAVLEYPLSDCHNKKQAKRNLLSFFARRAGRDALIRRDLLLWASETEDTSCQDSWDLPRHSNVAFPAMIKQVKRWLPQEISVPWNGRTDQYAE